MARLSIPQIDSLVQKLNQAPFLKEDTNYLVKSFWVMACAEFENQFRTLVINYLDKQKLNLHKTHANILLRGFYADQQKFNFDDVLNVYTRKEKDDKFVFRTENFTDSFQGLSRKSIEKIFTSLGILLNQKEQEYITQLDSFYSTRTAIVHANSEDIKLTINELEKGLKKLKLVFNFFSKKLR